MKVLCVALICLAAGCAPAEVVVEAPLENPAKPGCQDASDADFEGEGELALRRYLAWLARAHGTAVALAPWDVSLAIVRGDPKPGPNGVQVGEVSCTAHDYRITVYRDALTGRPLAVTYDTIAHEFHHVVQIRRDKLDCESPRGERAAYEREAVDFARSVVPACKTK